MSNVFPVLIGVIVGSLLGTAKDLLLERLTTKKDIEFLSVQIVCMLERFAQGCAEVTLDSGMPDSSGCMHVNSKTPELKLESIDVKWKALPANLMYEVLRFPIIIEDAEASIMSVWEHVSGPPDYSEMFEERQYQYAVLGLKAIHLAAKLRKKGKLPGREEGDCDYVECLTKKKSELAAKRE